jgi:3-mercaptopyruvate sulfurtransferase SseA
MGDCADSDTIRRDILSKEEMGKLLPASGADENSIIVLYGDSNNCSLPGPSGNSRSTATRTSG